ncbi:hypothetical protein [Xanthovirga aplysinae]|uniref:DUF3108 domain-containing protein n=1 Tax=Xanthovirga aplysinae TaxID=2529853 RepID=UPI0012BB7B73|nr:hypothetical protein [Xanthovirga aplysinae]MTI32102.1 hypothetical protein [Xanthovirga aplysinae]
MKKLLLIPFLNVLLFTAVFAQVDTVTFDNGMLKMKHLPFGKNYYLVYNQGSKDGPKYNFYLWERDLQKKEVKGIPSIVLDWVWQFPDSTKVITKKMVVKADNFAPDSEKVNYSTHFGKGRSYRQTILFEENKVVSSADTLEHNTKKIQQPFKEKPFNWELDMETFSMLPLGKGKKFAINFYHPGGSAPAYYTYEVVGEEKLQLNGKNVDCWLLKTEFEKGKGYAIWWLDKKSHLTYKMEEKFGELYRYKIWVNPTLFNSLVTSNNV